MEKSSDLLYERIAAQLERQILDDVLNVGDKLPSVRELSKVQGISVSTALQAYYHLEGKGLIESRPQSGYYVRFSPSSAVQRPAVSKPLQTARNKNIDAIISEVYDGLADPRVTKFSLSVPAPELLPLARLNKAMIQALQDNATNGAEYITVAGHAELRRQVARASMSWGGKLSEDDLITTAGTMNAISFALMALTQRGDTVAIESPAYFGTLRLLNSLGLRVLELPTHPDTGIDPDDLKKAIAKHSIKACLFVTNFGNPLGQCMPEENKERVVKLLSRHGIPLIEDDLYGDVFFGRTRPKSCKSYDEEGNVLWCDSVSKTLAPGYRVGWIAPGRFYEAVKRQKLYHSITNASPEQAAVASFLASGRYEHHLRELRRTLHGNCLQYIRTISESFPAGTRVTHPSGGFILWVELDERIDTYELFRRAMKFRISIAPGAIFTMQDRYHNCFRLTYGMVWNEKLEAAIRKLGSIAKEMLRQ
jgi:DNA-binding transcriptional MocR family regulator